MAYGIIHNVYSHLRSATVFTEQKILLTPITHTVLRSLQTQAPGQGTRHKPPQKATTGLNAISFGIKQSQAARTEMLGAPRWSCCTSTAVPACSAGASYPLLIPSHPSMWKLFLTLKAVHTKTMAIWPRLTPKAWQDEGHLHHQEEGSGEKHVLSTGCCWPPAGYLPYQQHRKGRHSTMRMRGTLPKHPQIKLLITKYLFFFLNKLYRISI